MPSFLFQMELPPMTEEMLSVIPRHREYINTLFSDGKMFSYSVSSYSNMIWCVVECDTEQMAMDMILKMPLYQYFSDINCHPLLFHNTQAAALPGLSLN
ncbi:MAG: hypothetical protein ACTHJ0_13345 [Flavipsychrobacter sp.]